MSKVITFSRVFPKYHPKAGQPTGFIEKIFHSIYKDNPSMFFDAKLGNIWLDPHLTGAKHHTIRNGNRWEVGNKFSPRVWSDKPYNSKQIILSEDLEIKQIYEIRIWRESLLNWRIYINGEIISAPKISELAANDGLTHRDLLDWFNVPIEKNFEGQIICWSDAVSYGSR